VRRAVASALFFSATVALGGLISARTVRVHVKATERESRALRVRRWYAPRRSVAGERFRAWGFVCRGELHQLHTLVSQSVETFTLLYYASLEGRRRGHMRAREPGRGRRARGAGGGRRVCGSARAPLAAWACAA
jgi:hypothetical protein